MKIGIESRKIQNDGKARLARLVLWGLVFGTVSLAGLSRGTVPLSPETSVNSAVAQARGYREGQLPAKTKVDRTCVFTDVEKIVAVGDLHGAYDEFVEILKGTKVVEEAPDGKPHWSGGRTHLVQLGDIMDRGPMDPERRGARAIFDLIIDLEMEAAAAGGRVHMLIGNHEEMNILGLSFEVRDGVSVRQFKDFLPAKYFAAREKGYKAKAGGDGDLDRFLTQLMDDPDAREEYTNFFNESYGRWIARHNAVVKINDFVFVHGGISEQYSSYPCDRLNSLLSLELQRWIRGERDFPLRMIRNNQGPLWYRDLAVRDEAILKDEVDGILKNLGARAMVVGHTPSQYSISLDKLSRFDEKIWIIDTGIWMETGGTLGALIIKNGKFRVWPKDDGATPEIHRKQGGNR
jgi:hypothetical protein